MKLYCNYALRGVDFGQIAYRDFTIEYPPLAWGLIACAAVASGRALFAGRLGKRTGPFPRRLSPHVSWRMFALDLVCLGLVWGIAWRHWPARLGSLCLAYVIASTSSLYLLYDRLDLGLLVLLLAWTFTWLRSIDGAAAWRLSSYAVLGLSVAFKVIPILMLPFLLLADRQAKPRMKVWSGLLAFAAAVAIPFLVLFPRAGFTPLRFIEYHGQRGIQVETIYATLLTALSLVRSRVQSCLHAWRR